jgi:hypothetical protein
MFYGFYLRAVKVNLARLADHVSVKVRQVKKNRPFASEQMAYFF